MTIGIQGNQFNNKPVYKHNMPSNSQKVLLFHCRITVPPHCGAESVIPPLCPLALAGLWPAALPHTASSGLSNTYASCLGPVWSSWQSAGGEWPGGTRLSVSVFPDHYDVWPERIIKQNPKSWLFIKHFSYINLMKHTKSCWLTLEAIVFASCVTVKGRAVISAALRPKAQKTSTVTIFTVNFTSNVLRFHWLCTIVSFLRASPF